ncbi:hypothetical protein ABG067_006275 [Albugo candida]
MLQENIDTEAVLFPKIGRLLRRDRRFPTWKWRDFVLERDRLQYFSVKGSRKGEICINESTPISIRKIDTLRPHSFIIYIKNEKITLAAGSEQERESWIDIFQTHFHANIEIVSSQTGEKMKKKPAFVQLPDATITEFSEEISDHDVGEDSFNAQVLPMAEKNSQFLSIEKSHTAEPNPLETMRKESDMTFGPLKEEFSKIIFPAKLPTHEYLLGVGPLVRRLGWSDERILAVGLYIDAESAWKELCQINLDRFTSYPARRSSTILSRCNSTLSEESTGQKNSSKRAVRVVKRLIAYGDQSFYNDFLLRTTFRRIFVISSRKRVSRSVLIALLHDELQFRVGSDAKEALEMFLAFIEKSLKKTESMVFRLQPDGTLEFVFRGTCFPPIASTALCRALQAMFFDLNSIQFDAKRGLVARLPSMWVHSELEEAPMTTDMQKSGIGTSGDEMDDEDDEDDDELEDQSDESKTTSPEKERSDSAQNARENEILYRSRRHTMQKLFDVTVEGDEAVVPTELQYQLSTRLGSMVDSTSHIPYPGNLPEIDGSVLLGTWSASPSRSLDQQMTCVGLYVDPVDASDCLLVYKGQSVGSIIDHPNFFTQFGQGAFSKHFVFKVCQRMEISQLIQQIAKLQQLVVIKHNASALSDQQASEITDPSVQAFMEAFRPHWSQRIEALEQLIFSIDRKNEMEARFYALNTDSEHTESWRILVPHQIVALLFQRAFYGKLLIDPMSRIRLLQRLPTLLDLAKDDLVHTYHDEIRVLRENYMRQRPEHRVKVGYMLLSYEKRKRIVTQADGNKSSVTIRSRWARRWCRLDGSCFSYYSSKRKKHPRQVIDITCCKVAEIKSSDTSTFSIFASDGQAFRQSLTIGMEQMDGKLLALKTESVYDGADWLECLLEAQKIPSTMPPFLKSSDPDASLNLRTYKDEHQSTMTLPGSSSAQTPDEIDVQPAASLDVKNGGTIANTTISMVECRKEGSIWLWLQEDARHRMLLIAWFLIVWLSGK